MVSRSIARHILLLEWHKKIKRRLRPTNAVKRSHFPLNAGERLTLNTFSDSIFMFKKCPKNKKYLGVVFVGTHHLLLEKNTPRLIFSFLSSFSANKILRFKNFIELGGICHHLWLALHEPTQISSVCMLPWTFMEWNQSVSIFVGQFQLIWTWDFSLLLHF